MRTTTLNFPNEQKVVVKASPVEIFLNFEKFGPMVTPLKVFESFSSKAQNEVAAHIAGLSIERKKFWYKELFGKKI
ncbi:MAG: hypothetical protein FWE50_03910 [Alphaproteobacteria bacterium]|nr:hypothetical protein [Alphaproteobacteria bacterium]